MNKQPWIQELMWVQRNESGVIVKYSEKPPESDDFIPYVPKEEGEC